VDVQWRPPFYADTRAAWQGFLPSRPGTPVRIEAAGVRGKPSFFRIIGPWTRATQMNPIQQSTGARIGAVAVILFLVVVIVGGIFFARRNLRIGRGDRRNATRLAVFIIGLIILYWIFGAHHVLTVGEAISFLIVVGLSLLVGGWLWVLYIAIEPFIRRRWPQILVSWTRLLSGEWRDPLVARDALIGCMFGVLMNCLYLCSFLVPSWTGHGDLIPQSTFRFGVLGGTRFFVSEILGLLIVGIFGGLGYVCFVLILRILLRNQKVAITASILFLALFFAPENLWSYSIALAMSACIIFLLMRFGFWAGVIVFFTRRLFVLFPTTLSASAWYSGYSFAALAIFAAIVLYAFRTSLGGRPLLTPSHLDD
jgi:hypothetical protein